MKTIWIFKNMNDSWIATNLNVAQTGHPLRPRLSLRLTFSPSKSHWCSCQSCLEEQVVTADSELSHAEDSPTALLTPLPPIIFPSIHFYQTIHPSIHPLRHSFISPSLPACVCLHLHAPIEWQPKTLTSTRCTVSFSPTASPTHALLFLHHIHPQRTERSWTHLMRI